MASFGSNLRREREMRGVPLDEIAGATKISVRTLQALEAEEFSKLPGGIFTRSFIRSYARYLGLDEETVLGEYQAVAPPSENVDLSRLTLSKPKPPKEGTKTPILGLLVAVVLLAGGYALFRYSRRQAESPVSASSTGRRAAPVPPGGTPQPTPAAPAGSPTTSLASTPPGSAGAGTTAQTAPSAAPGAANAELPEASKSSSPAALAASNEGKADSGLVLQVAASEEAWVGIDADGRTVLQRILEPNDIQTFKAEKSFDVRTGNAEGIILTLNGETLKPLGHRGQYRKVHVTRDDLKNPGP